MQLSKCARTPSHRFDELPVQVRRGLRPVAARLFRTKACGIALQAVLGATVMLFVAVQPAQAQETTEIANFSGIEEPHAWVFTGQVIAADPVDMVVTFGGILAGHSVTVIDPAGHFDYYVTISQSGTVTAQTEGSEIVEFFVDVDF